MTNAAYGDLRLHRLKKIEIVLLAERFLVYFERTLVKRLGLRILTLGVIDCR